MASAHQFTPKVAKQIPEKSQLASPEEAAGTMQKPLHLAGRNFSTQEPEQGRLSMSHALRVQSAHYWLELGEVDQALLELGTLSTNAFNHPLAVKARVAVLRAVRMRGEVSVQE